MKLRIATYNVASCHAHYNYSEENPKAPFAINDVIEAIKSLDADICGLNELDSKNGRTEYVDQLGEIKSALNYDGFFSKSIDLRGGEYGNGVITKLPILEMERIAIPDPEVKEAGKPYESRSIAKIKLDVAGGLTVLVTHVGLMDSEKVKAIDTLCEVIDSVDTPVVLMGDFNMEPDHPLFEKIRARLQDTHKLLDGGNYNTYATHPSKRNFLIDYIFVSKEITPISLEKPDIRVSDHFPLVLTVEI